MKHQRPFALRPMLCTAMLLALSSLPVAAQNATATLSGTVADQNGAVVPNTNVAIVSNSTGLKRDAVTNDEGNFTVPLLQPGTYTVRAQHDGFKIVQVDNVTLNVGDQKSIQIPLQTGDVSETVNVTGDAPLIDESSAVGTVVDRHQVENMPLNGRSFQSLLQLTPGVVITPAADGSGQGGGQFSVNGQRTNANYFTVDGVGANTGIASTRNGFIGQSGSGQLPALTASGTTSSLVSVDALQEFRIQTSGFAPEFGPMPGGQVSLVTRSGANDFHGGAFEYFRNDVFDANNWFSNANRLDKAALRQNLFGGTLSGPVMLPKFGEGGPSWYNGRNRTFFFFSYEGLRLVQPKTGIVTVPNVNTRNNALPQYRPYLDANPLPNRQDLGNGFAEFAASYSDPSRFDATSVRIDHNSDPLTFFGRFSYTPSFSKSRSGSLTTIGVSNQTNRAITLGSTWLISNRIINDLRVNFTTNDGPFRFELDSLGGAVPPPPSIFLPGMSPESHSFQLIIIEGGGFSWGNPNSFKQRQFNIVENLTITRGAHQLKFGTNFRRINPLLNGGPGGGQGLQLVAADLTRGTSASFIQSVKDPERRAVAFDNLSLYGQDTWKISRRLALTYGIRWEFVPPPRVTEGRNAVTLENLDNPYGGQVGIAPPDTPLWKTRYNNFAPRFGISYLVSEKPGAQLVVRGGAGIFHDLGFGHSAEAFANTYPFFLSKTVRNTPFPLTPAALAPPVLGVDPPSQLWVMDRDIVLPRTYQWNVSAERSLGAHQTVTVSFVGAEGRQLLKPEAYRIRLVQWATAPGTTAVQVNRNLGRSNYRALQVQFQRRLTRGFQSLISYTFGRSRDTASDQLTGTIPGVRLSSEVDFGYSDYDVRHLFNGALTYQVPKLKGQRAWEVVANNWAVDLIFLTRSAFPVRVAANVAFPPDSFQARPNVVPGQPFWIEDPTAPGGRRLNRAAFVIPPASTQGDLPRGAVRGFNARQINMAVRREFPLFEKVRMQLRFEAFNVFNWPNFADPSVVLSTGTPANFGRATFTLDQRLGGLSPLYQIGGPRSVQASIKLLF